MKQLRPTTQLSPTQQNTTKTHDDTYNNGNNNQELIRQDNGSPGTFMRLASVGLATYNDLWWHYSDRNNSYIAIASYRERVSTPV
jgi:hypothetical protein